MPTRCGARSIRLFAEFDVMVGVAPVSASAGAMAAWIARESAGLAQPEVGAPPEEAVAPPEEAVAPPEEAVAPPKRPSRPPASRLSSADAPPSIAAAADRCCAFRCSGSTSSCAWSPNWSSTARPSSSTTQRSSTRSMSSSSARRGCDGSPIGWSQTTKSARSAATWRWSAPAPDARRDRPAATALTNWNSIAIPSFTC